MLAWGRMRKRRSLVLAGLLGACGSGRAEGPDAAAGDAAPELDAPVAEVGEVPETAQRDGDPEAGYHALVNLGYVGCGMPYSLYQRFFSPASEEERIPGREGRNADLPYLFNAFTPASGVEVVWANCLSCHAGWINGELVIGLGAADLDFTRGDLAALAELSGSFVSPGPEQDEWRKWADRMAAIGPYTQMATVGPNPADNLSMALFAHHDQATLAWSNDWLLDPPPEIVIPVDVPPWWRMKKKRAMFYNGMGRGDQARIMMTASTFCIDSVAQAEEVDAYFPDIRAYLASLEPPPWPFAVDAPLAEAGKVVFERECARCHGTYGDPAGETYPNLVIALEEVGTDPIHAIGILDHTVRFVNWFNGSFYGELARLEPAPGYYAPPLDGVWATAPYLHNGSVPTIAALLDSASRPASWTRTFDSTDYDPVALGWRFTALDHGQEGAANEDERRMIYDTTLLGYGNGGHLFGDDLEIDDRTALLEYLKTI